MSAIDESIHWRLADLHLVEKTGLKVFSTFACGGGSSMGYKLAGFTMVGANDIDEEMEANYRPNLHPPRYFRCPVKDLADEDMELPDELYNLDILDGSPPCSTFSTAGLREQVWGVEKHFREGQAVQVLDDLFFDFIRVVARLRPKAVIAENVKGMLVGNARGYVRAVMKALDAIGYRAQLFLVNAADCGVPQVRERVFFVALRKDIDKPPLRFAPARRRVTAGEALADIIVPDEEKHWLTDNAKEPWRKTLPGGCLGDHFRRSIGKDKWFTHHKLSPSQPSMTLISTSIHTISMWNEPRYLHVDEFRALSTFPVDYVFTSITSTGERVQAGKKIGGYLMGMSVPPFMMRDVASAVRDQWF